MIVYGVNPVREALRVRRVTLVRASERGSPRVRELARGAVESGVTVQWVPAVALDRVTRGAGHQGIVAWLEPLRSYSVGDLLDHATPPALLLVLDGVEDPQNLGAVLRTAEAAGVDGVIRQRRRAAPLGGAVAKASAGALALVRIASVVNVARALDELKAAGVWTVGLAQAGRYAYDEVDLTTPTALVVGAEGTGLRRLIRERCDWLVSIPLLGRVESLNLSVATGIALYEAVRQRRRPNSGS